MRSKPIGFYTWNERLREIFKQDRVLQQALNHKEEIEVIVRSLHSDPESRHIYENYLRLLAKLTNPFEPGQISLLPLLEGLDGGQLEMTEPEYYFFPSSRSHERDLIQRLYGDKSIPEGFSLAEEMVRRIESGTLQLTPSEESGWYDYQTWAPEGLLLPPCRKLQYTDSYRKQLKNLFKSMLALTRETHIKQLRIPPVTRARGMLDIWSRFRRIPVYIGPQLSVEPVPVYYLRRAVAYRFIRNLLLKHLGSDALGSLHRLTPEGPVEASLASELEQIGALFFGAFLTASAEAGISKDERDREIHLQAVQYGRLNPEESHSLGMGGGEDSDHDYFLNWAKERQDPDLSRDARMMVPIFYDIEKRKTKVWVFLGWSWFALTVNFAIPPKVRIFDLLGCDVTRKHRVEYVATRYSIPYPVMAEIYVERVLDRDEFRRVCDRYQCASEILKNIDQNRIPLP